MNRETVLERLLKASPVIAPSMLKCDFGNLQRDIQILETAGAEILHLDVMDGHFVPNLSYGPVVIERMREITSLPFDAHLMISEPARYLDDYLRVGCEMITVHIEVVPDPRDLLDQILDRGAAAGLALNPDTPVKQVEPFVEHCDLILVMSVEPGFGGQQFMPVAIDKLRALRQLVSPDTILSVDGGIAPGTIGATAEAGANLFVAGSSVFDQPDYRIAIEEMQAIAVRHSLSSASER